MNIYVCGDTDRTPSVPHPVDPHSSMGVRFSMSIPLIPARFSSTTRKSVCPSITKNEKGGNQMLFLTPSTRQKLQTSTSDVFPPLCHHLFKLFPFVAIKHLPATVKRLFHLLPPLQTQSQRRHQTTMLFNFLAVSLIWSQSSVAAFHLVSLPPTKGKSVAFQREPKLMAVPASCVSVCTAELCCCQEDSLGGDEIFKNLESRGLPYAVEEAPCLGACGGGAMVAIDFEDGSYALVSGMEETLQELGLESLAASDESSKVDEESNTVNVAEISPVVESKSEPTTKEEIIATSFSDKSIDVAEPVNDDGKDLAAATEAIEKPVLEVKIESTPPPTPPVETATEKFGDVRDRMREETAKDEEAPNPWLTAASYLAKKAGEKIFSK